MSKHLKVLVVDDTIFYRQLLSKLLEEIPDVDLMGVAPNGKIALKKIELFPPDLVLMDMAMPEMDGLETLDRIKAHHPEVDVVMISSADREAAALTVKALESGALDFISKPRADSADAAVEALRAELTPLIALVRTMKYSREARRISRDKLPVTPGHASTTGTFPSSADEKSQSLRSIQKPIVKHRAQHGVASVQDESELTKDKFYSTKQEVGSAKQELGSAKQELGSAKQELGSAKQELGSAKQELGSAKQELGSAKQELGSTKQEYNSIKKESASTLSSPHPVGKKRSPGRIDVVAIGVSTGGPNTLKQVIPKISGDFPVPILIVQHMPPMFTATLAESLNRMSNITVVEGKAGQIVEKGVIYIAPGGRHMVVRKGEDSIIKLGLVDTPPVHNCRPAVDVLFRSVALAFGGNVLTVILTGMGQDGTSGVAAIRRKGGYSIVQDEKSSVVWGMPGAVVEAGEADEIHGEEHIADRIMELVRKSRL
ncbi:chemotaxis-specific protein-glutamate methyltransferase CheB [Desulfamplus magnetovallimortis]|nr:chemotaxis-specific protein-glutamate methyltransferase CheB [Desulfamplus magnetovallimortis]